MTATAIVQQIDSTQLDIDTMRAEGIPEEVIQGKEKQLCLYRQMLDYIQNPPVILSLSKEICDAFVIPPEVLFSHTRKREIVNARQVYIYCLVTTNVKRKEIIPYEKTIYRKRDPLMDKRDMPNAIARHIGFDHATALWAIKVTWDYYQTEPFYRNLIDRIQRMLLEGKIEMPNIDPPVNE
jgi:hypothetical protein